MFVLSDRPLHAINPASAHAVQALRSSRSPEETVSQKDISSSPKDTVRVTKASDRETVVAGSFDVAQHVLFAAITQPEHLKQWMNAGGMSLSAVDVDRRADGSFRYVFRRPSGKTIEVRGAYRTYDPPRRFSYRESYDFSPLEIDVSTALEELGSSTRFTQTLHYFSTRERDEDFDGVATSSREAYSNLMRYLRSTMKE